MSGYQTLVGRIREDTKRKVMAAWRMYGTGQITRAQFEQLAAAILGQAGAKAATAADLAISLELSALNRRLEATAGVLPKRRTYMDAIVTILDDTDHDTIMQLKRLALNAPLEAAQTAASTAISQSGASGWVRQMDPDPCQLCRWWYRDGRVLSLIHI